MMVCKYHLRSKKNSSDLDKSNFAYSTYAKSLRENAQEFRNQSRARQVEWWREGVDSTKHLCRDSTAALEGRVGWL